MSIPEVFDQTLKIIARKYTQIFLRLAFPDKQVHLVGTVENVELALPVHPVDFVHRVEYEEKEYLLHIEFQLQHEADFPRRLCYYYGALTKQFDLPVLTLVLYLRPRKAAVPQAYEVCLGDQVINSFHYPVLRLWDYVDEIRSGTYRELVPLLLLLDPEKEKTALLQEERALIGAEPDPQKRQDLLALAVTIATRHFDSRYLWQFFTEEEVNKMREATFIDELMEDKLNQRLAQARQKIHQEGRQEGRREGAQQNSLDNILDVLIARFNPPASQYRQIEKQLRSMSDLDQLRELLLVLVQADDVAAFEQAVMQQASA